MAGRALISGAAGLLGSACAAALLDRGYEIVALVRDRDPRSRLYSERLVDRCVEVRAELADAERLLARYEPELVLHLGAQTQVPVAMASPVGTFEANVRGTWLLLEACRLARRRPAAIVVASSDKAYGEAPLPYREDGPLQPRAPYDVSKACTDLIARSYASTYELPIAVTRCGNLYGPGDLNRERLVPGALFSLLRGEAPRLRSTGGMSREWLYVDDAAAANLRILDGLAAGEPLRARAFNVGGGEVDTVRGVVERLCALVPGAPAPIFAMTDPSGEIPHQALDSGALQALGWRARVPLSEGLARTAAWAAAILGSEVPAGA